MDHRKGIFEAIKNIDTQKAIEKRKRKIMKLDVFKQILLNEEVVSILEQEQIKTVDNKVFMSFLTEIQEEELVFRRKALEDYNKTGKLIEEAYIY